MDKRPKRKDLRLNAYDYSAPGYYFVTICTKVRREDILCHLSCGDVETTDAPVGGGLRAAPPDVCLTPIGKIVDNAILHIPVLHENAEIDTYCIMPDHIHCIIRLTTGRDGARPLPDIVGRMKSFTDLAYRRLNGPDHPKLWQRGYYEHVIRGDADLTDTRRYIRDNHTAAGMRKEERPMEWNDYLNIWGRDLQGLAQGGVLYGEGGEDALARYTRVKEIAGQLLESTASAPADDAQAAVMAASLRQRVPGLTEEQADAMAREVLGETAGVTRDQVRAWGAELETLAAAALDGDLENPFDIDRYEVIRQVGGKMRDC